MRQKMPLPANGGQLHLLQLLYFREINFSPMRLTILFLWFSVYSLAQVNCSSNTKADVAAIASAYKKHGSVTEDMRLLYPINHVFGGEFVSFLGKKGPGFDAASLEERGIHVGSEINGIVSFRYPVQEVEAVLSENGFSMIQLAGKVKPMLNHVPIGTHADSVWAGIGLPESYTGKDVIVGITDWGFDYTSPMFYDTLLQNTRIISAWDQYKLSGPAPTLYGYGTEYNTPAEFQSAGSDTANIYSYHTHGTHVAGIAGGSGAGTQYRGIGFECNYLFTTFLVDEAAVMDAWDWMYNKATALGKRLVVNMSWGLYHMGALDGTALVSQALDSYSDLGVVFVTSAGNNGDVNFHIMKDFSTDTLQTQISFYNNPSLPTVWGQSIHMWGEAGNSFNSALRIYNLSNQLLVESPFYSTATTTSYVDSFLVASGTDTVWFNLSADNSYPTNGRPEMRLRIKYPPSGYRIVLASTAPGGKVHYWNVTELTNDVGNWGMDFVAYGAGGVSGDNKYGIGIPACTHSAISIAAYSSEYYAVSGNLIGGAAASFSSVGPLITDSLKPDVTAPGVSVASSISSFTDASFAQITAVNFNGRTYPFARFSGTSMSSPAAAGVVTLMLDANPYLSATQVKDILIATARTDSYTGAIPPHDTKWGWGKVNAYAAVQLALITTGTEEIPVQPLWTVYPNPAGSVLHIDGLSGSPELIEIVDLHGNRVLKPESTDISVESLSSGVYFVRVIIDGKVQQQRFIRE